MQRSSSRYVYGKTHHVLYPYKKRIHDACNRYLERLRDTKKDYEINNLFIDFRNEMCHVIGEIYQQLSIEAKHNVVLTPTPRKEMIWPKRNPDDRCLVCGEDRIVDKCHLIPREHSGSSSMDNIILLCPTHHFLFDHSGLSEDEFGKIDTTGKAQDSCAYLNDVRLKSHKRHWHKP